MQDVGLYGVKTCWVQCHRYQTPLNLLIYRGLFGNYERVTDSHLSLILTDSASQVPQVSSANSSSTSSFLADNPCSKEACVIRSSSALFLAIP